jgi:hypothetical protein
LLKALTEISRVEKVCTGQTDKSHAAPNSVRNKGVVASTATFRKNKVCRGQLNATDGVDDEGMKNEE